MSTFTPCSTSMRSVPRVKCLWTSRTRTREFESVMNRSLSLHNDFAAVSELRWRREHDALAGSKTGEDLDAVAVGAADLHGPALDDLAIDDEHVLAVPFGANGRLRHERNRLRHRRA